MSILKTLTLSLLILLSQIAYSQNESPRATFNVTYSTGQTLGMNFLAGKDLLFGFEGSVYLGRAAVGRDYSNIIGPNTYSKDIYEIVDAPNVSASLLLGKTVSKGFSVFSKIGFGTTRRYYNGYDPSQILSPNGYWYTSQPLSTNLLIGAGVQYTVNKLALQLHYDQFNKVTFGLGIGF